jgi:hypothetical protein
MLTLSMKRSKTGAAHVEICFDKRQLAHGDIHPWVLRRLITLGSFILENGHVGRIFETEISTTPRSRESTDP